VQSDLRGGSHAHRQNAVLPFKIYVGHVPSNSEDNPIQISIEQYCYLVFGVAGPRLNDLNACNTVGYCAEHLQ